MATIKFDIHKTKFDAAMRDRLARARKTNPGMTQAALAERFACSRAEIGKELRALDLRNQVQPLCLRPKIG